VIIPASAAALAVALTREKQKGKNMPKLAYNLERHPTVKGAYIAYDAQGFAFRISGSTGNWRARPSYYGVPPSHCALGGSTPAHDLRTFAAATLNALAAKVAASKPEEA